MGFPNWKVPSCVVLCPGSTHLCVGFEADALSRALRFGAYTSLGKYVLASGVALAGFPESEDIVCLTVYQGLQSWEGAITESSGL